MSDPASTTDATADPGKSSANDSTSANDKNPPVDPNEENVNKDPLLKPNSTPSKEPSVKSVSSRTLRLNRRAAKQAEKAARQAAKDSKAAEKEAKKSTSKKHGNPKKQERVEKESSKKVHQVDKSSKAASVTSTASRRSTRAHLQLQLRKLEAEQTLLEEKKKLIDQQFSVLEELADLDDEEAETDDEEDGDSKVKRWLGEGEEEDSENTDCSDEDPEDADPDSDLEETESEDSSNQSSEDEEEEEEEAARFNPKKRSTPKRDRLNRQQKNTTSSNQLNCSLTRSQLAARHVVARDLPVFSGDPEEWPMFSSTYESTTRMCGYTDDENMIRLRNCLKGDAYATVRSFLLHPSTVHRAMDALKLRFGQPQFVIHSLRDKLLAMPPLKADSMNKMIDFALAVQNLEATIAACGRKEYTRDVSLLNELVGKLPASMKLEWARHTRCIRKVNLSTFSEWVYHIAEDACLVCEVRGNQGSQQTHEQRKKSKAFLNTHAEQREPRKENPHASKPSGERNKVNASSCVACKRGLYFSCKVWTLFGPLI